MSYIKIGDWSVSSTFEFSLIPFTNKGLNKEVIKKEIEKVSKVNTVYLGNFNGSCEVTLYSSCFNKTTIESVVEEIEERLNRLLGNQKNIYWNLSEQDYWVLFGKGY